MKGKYGKIVFYLEVKTIIYRLVNQDQCSKNWLTTQASMLSQQPVQVNHPGEPTAVLMMLSLVDTSDLALETCSVSVSLKTLTKEIMALRLWESNIKL